ncbi:ANTAR domain-containing protein [Streptomyces flavofungini]|uniref:ANTAR domain-containing protein n=1 Tax=Streptomyces flavofungini TaxID=68200 RepID=A0ABS0XFY2_9ACTN|nr:ANTAR domain-containing protein [Streptomyces flavofungini]MBJ3812129.1 ANTAR domain-containing protein [Streptomyces flavofungini]GHC44068.1 transcriptional regulator [Streptomyces flavofungini]
MLDRTSARRLAQVLVEAADTAADDFDAERHLRRFSQHCAELLGVLGAGVMYADAGSAVRLAVSDKGGELAQDLLEAQATDGPCLESYGTGSRVPPVRLTTADALARWPDFTKRARARGVVATYAVPLRARKRVLGALNVFTAPEPNGNRPDGSPQEGEDDSALALAQALADAAGVGLHNHRAYAQYRDLSQQLQAALTSRIRIEQAKGILAERWRTELDVAFEALRRHARRERLVMDVVAGMVIEGALDDATLLG